MEFRKDRSAGFLVNRVARIFARGLGDRIRPLGITTGTFPVLLELWEADGLTQRQLVERLDIEQATMANTLARMERDGLITRTRSETDGRAQQVWLTPSAQQIRDPAIAAARDQNAETLACLTGAEQRQFLDILGKLIAADQPHAAG